MIIIRNPGTANPPLGRRLLKRISLLSIAALALVACNNPQTSNPSQPVSSAPTPVTGPFSAEELRKFQELDPVDTHVHIYQTNPAFLALLAKLNLHVLNIIVTHTPDQPALD